MPTPRKDVIRDALKKSGISKARMGKELGFKSRVAFYKHFKKEDIDLNLFNRIMQKLSEKGFNIDGAVTQNYKGSSGSSQTEGDMHGNFVGQPNENNYGVSSETMDNLIMSYDKQILFLQKQIEEKDKRIKDLEEIISNKK